jgi:hypothetical protein
MLAEAYLGGGVILASLGELDEARIALTAAYEHPEAGEAVRRQAGRMLSSIEGNQVAVIPQIRSPSDFLCEAV